MKFIAITKNENLSHSGIKGMHWGIRNYQNLDGSLTPAGRERYGVGERTKKQKIDLINKTKGPNYSKLKTPEQRRKAFEQYRNNLINDEGFSNQIKRIKSELSQKINENDKAQKKLHSVAKDYYNNITLYKEASALTSYMRYANTDDPGDISLENFGNYTWDMIDGDGDQGFGNSSDIFTMLSPNRKVVESCVETFTNFDISIRKFVRDACSNLLGETDPRGLFEKKDISFNSAKATVQFQLKDALQKLPSDDDYSFRYQHYRTYRKSMPQTDINNAKKAVAFAKTIPLPKTRDSNGYGYWNYLNQAAENLGFSSTKMKDLSSSDWKRINAEIEKLKR